MSFCPRNIICNFEGLAVPYRHTTFRVQETLENFAGKKWLATRDLFILAVEHLQHLQRSEGYTNGSGFSLF